MGDPRLQPFHYDLPARQVARHPPADRDGGRLLVVGEGPPVDAAVRDLPAWLRPGDLLALNDTRVIPARVHARRATGGAVEVLLLEEGPEGGTVGAMVRPGRRLRPGERLSVDGEDGLGIELVAPMDDGAWTVRAHPSARELLARAGHVPLPPYLDRPDEPEDRVRYQTVYAGPPGSVAAPTAGLHLSEALLARIAALGVPRASLTLHVGPGTFRNLRPADLDAGALHEERFIIPEETAGAVAGTRARGGRVVAVGTTTTRALESAATGGGRVRPGPGATRLFIRDDPPFRFQVVDALLTNFHLPGSSLLMLVCAFGGRERVLAAYRHAVREGYRFFSYGDAMLVLGGGG